MKRLAILGASGHGKVVADCAECAGWDEILFYDDAWPNLEVNGPWRVIGDTSALLKKLSNYDGVVVAIGDNNIRLAKHNELASNKAPLISVIHPSAEVSQYATVGVGSVVMPCAAINVGTNLGVCCIINTGALIDHDCLLGDAVHVSPGANLAGGVTVGTGVWVGIGANIKQMIKIGKNSVVGGGSVVIRDIIDDCTVAGVPAKVIT